MNDKIDITLTINGRSHAIRVEPRKTLVDAIRDDCGQTGTHIGCEHGVCGACTVRVDGAVVRGCLILAVQCDGARVVIDACKPFGRRDTFPLVVRNSAALDERIIAKFKDVLPKGR